MTTSLDLNIRHWAKQRGEITGIGTWITIDGKARPCLALIRTNAPLHALHPYVITLDRAWIWSEDVGDPRSSAHQCFGICRALNLEPTQDTIFKIVTFVHDHLGDLLTIPPFPPAAAPANTIAELVITNTSSGETFEVALNDV